MLKISEQAVLCSYTKSVLTLPVTLLCSPAYVRFWKVLLFLRYFLLVMFLGPLAFLLFNYW